MTLDAILFNYNINESLIKSHIKCSDIMSLLCGRGSWETNWSIEDWTNNTLQVIIVCASGTKMCTDEHMHIMLKINTRHTYLLTPMDTCYTPKYFTNRNSLRVWVVKKLPPPSEHIKTTCTTVVRTHLCDILTINIFYWFKLWQVIRIL